MTSPFDRALANREMTAAARAYALRHGHPGTAEYRAAWLRFRRRIRIADEVGAWQSPVEAVERDVLEVLNAAIGRATRIDGTSMATAQLYDPHLGGLRLVAQRGFSHEFLEFFQIVDDTASACGSALASAVPVWIPDITRSSVFAGTDSLEVMLGAGSRAVVSLPIQSPTGQVIAMVSTHHPRPTRWTGRREARLRRLSEAAGLLIHSVLEPRADLDAPISTRGPTVRLLGADRRGEVRAGIRG